MLANIDGVAKAEKWDEVLPKVVSDIMKYQGNYIAVPVNVHRVNWLWANPEAFKKAGAKLPTNWDEFFSVAEALKKAGLIPVAHGGQNWQDFTTFESVALGVGGADFYKKALVALDPATLASPTMETVLATFKRVKDYTDKNGRSLDRSRVGDISRQGSAASRQHPCKVPPSHRCALVRQAPRHR